MDVQIRQLFEVELAQIRVPSVGYVQRTHLRPQQYPIDHVTHPFPSGLLRVKVHTVVEFQE